MFLGVHVTEEQAISQCIIPFVECLDLRLEVSIIRCGGFEVYRRATF